MRTLRVWQQSTIVYACGLEVPSHLRDAELELLPKLLRAHALGDDCLLDQGGPRCGGQVELLELLHSHGKVEKLRFFEQPSWALTPAGFSTISLASKLEGGSLVFLPGLQGSGRDEPTTFEVLAALEQAGWDAQVWEPTAGS
eukprot:7289418-Alexandrium_andersonii.AAC.1